MGCGGWNETAQNYIYKFIKKISLITMGNSCQVKTNLLAKNWIKINPKTFKNNITEELINEYQVQYQNEEQLISNNTLLMKRVNINHPNIVKIIYFYQNQEKTYCTNRSFRHKMYIQQYKQLLFSYLTDHRNNRPNQCYCCPIINGFYHLTDKYGFFNVSEKMIYISSQSSWKRKQEKVMVKVWLNEKLQMNSPQKIITQYEMCDQLIQLIKKMLGLGFCCSPQIKNIPKIFHIDNLLNYIYNAHNSVHKKETQPRKRIQSTISSINSLVQKANLNNNSSKESLNLKNRSFSHYLNQNKSINTLNTSLEPEKKDAINNTPKKQYAEPSENAHKFKHFNYVSSAYEKRKSVKVNFVYNNDNLSTPKQNYNNKMENIHHQHVQPRQFQLAYSVQRPENVNNQSQTKRQMNNISQDMEKSSNINTKPESSQVVVKDTIEDIDSKQGKIEPFSQEDLQLSMQSERLAVKSAANDIHFDRIYNKNEVKSYKNQTEREHPQIIEEQNENHSNQEEQEHAISNNTSHLDKKHQIDHLQGQFMPDFDHYRPKNIKNNGKVKNTFLIQIPQEQLFPNAKENKAKNNPINQFNQKEIISEEQLKRSIQNPSRKQKKFVFVPNFGKSKELSSPRSFKSDKNNPRQKASEYVPVLNQTTSNLDYKYENYLKKFNNFMCSNKDSSSKLSSKKESQVSKEMKVTSKNEGLKQTQIAYEKQVYKSLKGEKDSMRDKSNTKYSIGYKREVQSLYNESNASKEETLKAKLIQKIQNTEKIIRENRKELQKIELQKDLERQKYIIKSEMQNLLQNNLFSEESNLIKEKVKHKKATFAELKAQAAKILQDLQF